VIGDVDLTGNGVLNPNDPLSFQIYGVQRPKDSSGAYIRGSMKIAGNGGFRGAAYGPDYDLTLVGGGNADTIYGAFVARTITMTGVQAIHYDEAMAEGGLIADYRVISWYEDMK
jgi:hypothetical protein